MPDGESRAYELNFPMIPVAASAHAGQLPPSHSFVQVGPGNVILTVVTTGGAALPSTVTLPADSFSSGASIPALIVY